jgi:hypothetical protein
MIAGFPATFKNGLRLVVLDLDGTFGGRICGGMYIERFQAHYTSQGPFLNVPVRRYPASH